MPNPATRLFIVDQTLKDFQGHHFEYDAAIAEAAEAAKLEPVILANKKYEKVGAEAAEVVPWFRTSWYESSADAKHAHTFWNETLDFFKQRAVTPDDIVLIHTVSFAEFVEIVDYYEGLLWQDVARLPTVYVILRRDPDECAQPVLEALKVKLRRLYEVPDLSSRLRLCTDTDQLRDGWSDALGQPVLTLPIPFRHSLVDRLERKREPGAPVQVVYLGDARNEKGYQHFPGMVQALWKDFIQPGRVEVTLQSNYNMPGGEGGIPQARLRLQRYPHGVTLITDTMEPEAYYALLAKADIVVLPYDPQAYVRRSSGVLNEAIAAGKVTVVPEGTWLASQVDPARAVVYRHPGGLADAVIAAVEKFPELARGAAAHQPGYRNQQNPQRFVQALVQNRGRIERPSSGAVLYVMDGDSVFNRSGAGSVAHQQLQALIALGYRIHAVFQRLHIEDFHEVKDLRSWMDTIREELREYKLASVWGVGHAPFYGHAGLMSERQLLRSRHVRLDADAGYRAAFAVPSGLIEALRDDPPNFALVNYAQSIPFARLLAGPQTPILAEAHDIQSFQIALRNPEGFQKADLDLELNLLKEARHVVVLNQIEADFLAERIGRERVSFVAQPVSDGPARLAKLAGSRDLAELVQNCGATDPSFDRMRVESAGEQNSAAYFRTAKTIDLLYVSSSHVPNLQGLKLFLHNVFYPRLIERGVTLAVAGTVCDDLKDVEGPQVLLAHRVKDLEPLYAAARIVILPILDGAGSAIKSIEALARAKPVVATSFAMRGVDRSSEDCPVHDDWDDFGDRILELLASPEKRLAAAQASFRLSLVNGNDGGYVRRLGRAVAATLGQREAAVAAPLKPPGAAAAPLRLIEWSQSIRSFNALCADYLLRGYLAPGDLAAYRDGPLQPEDAKELFNAAFATLDSSARRAPDNDPKALLDRLTQLIEGATAPREAQPTLDSPEILVPAGASSRAIAFDGEGAEQVIWRSADQRTAKRAFETGLLSVTLPSAPPGTVVEQAYDLVAAPSVGLAPCVIAGGMYPREESSGPPRRWTGPSTAATFVVTLCRRYDAEICIDIHDALQAEVYEQAWLEADGFRLPTLKSSRDRRMLIAPMPAAPEAVLDRVGIVLHVPRTLTPSSIIPGNVDHRQLGLALGRMEIRCQITTAPLKGPSPVAQTLAAMMERTPADLVFGGYRDLLGRVPDPSGYAHYVEHLTERRMTATEFFRALIGSDEFKTRYSAPGLADLIDRCLPKE